MAEFSDLQILKPGDVKPDRGRWLIHGPQGAGKTTLASTIAYLGKTLFVDLIGEHGTRSFVGAPYASNIDVIRPTSIQQLDDIMWELNTGNHDYECVVLDSLTSLQKMAMRYLQGHSETTVREIEKGAKPPEFGVWGQAQSIMNDTAVFWCGLADGNRDKPMHVVLISQTKITDDEATGRTIRVPDVQPGAMSAVLANPDYVVYCDLEQDMDAMGDDSLPQMKHILRFGTGDMSYRLKARVPEDLRGKIPPVLGRKRQASLADLSKALRIGGTSTTTTIKN